MTLCCLLQPLTHSPRCPPGRPHGGSTSPQRRPSLPEHQPAGHRREGTLYCKSSTEILQSYFDWYWNIKISNQVSCRWADQNSNTSQIIQLKAITFTRCSESCQVFLCPGSWLSGYVQYRPMPSRLIGGGCTCTLRGGLLKIYINYLICIFIYS